MRIWSPRWPTATTTPWPSFAARGQAEVLVPDIQTANATVHLIDAVMLPPAG